MTTYTKNTWVDEVLAADERYDILDDGGTPIESNVQINLSTSVAVAGTPVTAAKMQNIEDGIEAIDILVEAVETELDTEYPKCSVTHNADQTISNGTNTIIDFNTEVYDSDGLHEGVTNPDRITITEDGRYHFTFRGTFEGNSSGRRSFVLKVNGTAMAAKVFQPIGTVATAQDLSADLDLSAGDYVQVEVYQNSGGDLDILTSNYSPFFECFKIR